MCLNNINGGILMIQLLRLGSPIFTGAVQEGTGTEEALVHVTAFPDWTVEAQSGTLSRQMPDRMAVLGLGETVRGINKRGWIYVSNNSDDPNHTEDKQSLYASQNFILLTQPGSGTAEGIFVDDPGTVTFDIGYTETSTLTIRSHSGNADIYRFTAPTALDVVRDLRRLTGRSYIPPKWAFGFGQSRWGYRTENDIREVADTYHRNGIPIDSIYLDIDYMERYKDFTINIENFPDFTAFVEEMRGEGIHLVPIIDAGVKIEDGYDVYEEGCRNDYFVKKENGERLVAAVWPGRVHFPDFLNPAARRWFGLKYRVLLDQGVDGFWNDMNEPAIFYTEDHLKEVFSQIESYRGQNLDIHSFFEFKDLVATIDNNPEDYRRFVHDFNGQKIRHDLVHNLYGFYMTRAAGEAMRELSPEKRILLFSRSSYIGMHRYGGVWTGDNRSWWSHLLLSLQQMPALNMCGFLYTGSDIGGFGSDCTEDLMARWLELAILTPLYRNHACQGTRNQELYRFGHSDDFRHIIELRYALIPYIYSEFMKAALRDGMYFEPFSFEWPDDTRAAETEDQILAGESLMIAPVVHQNQTGRVVYLPEDMKLLRFRSWNDFDEEILPKGDHYISFGLFETILFLRKGHVLPLAAPAPTTGELDYSTIHFITYDADPELYELYDDDGLSRV